MRRLKSTTCRVTSTHSFYPASPERKTSASPAPLAEEPSAKQATPGEKPSTYPAPWAEKPAASPAPLGEKPSATPAPLAEKPSGSLGPPGEKPSAYAAPPGEKPSATGEKPARQPAPLAEKPSAYAAPVGEQPSVQEALPGVWPLLGFLHVLYTDLGELFLESTSEGSAPSEWLQFCTNVKPLLEKGRDELLLADTLREVWGPLHSLVSDLVDACRKQQWSTRFCDEAIERGGSEKEYVAILDQWLARETASGGKPEDFWIQLEGDARLPIQAAARAHVEALLKALQRDSEGWEQGTLTGSVWSSVRVALRGGKGESKEKGKAAADLGGSKGPSSQEDGPKLDPGDIESVLIGGKVGWTECKVVELFYFTERARANPWSDTDGNRYTNQRRNIYRDGRFECGWAEVEVEAQYLCLAEPRSAKILKVAPLATECTAATFHAYELAVATDLRSKITAKKLPSKAVLCIHGYKTGFEDALKMAARTMACADLEQLGIVLDWPSANSLGRYPKDQDQMNPSAGTFFNTQLGAAGAGDGAQGKGVLPLLLQGPFVSLNDNLNWSDV
jgi:hypothetical protein